MCVLTKFLNMKIFFRVLFLAFLAFSCSNKSDGNWQQHVSYTMVIDVDAGQELFRNTRACLHEQLSRYDFKSFLSFVF